MSQKGITAFNEETGKFEEFRNPVTVNPFGGYTSSNPIDADTLGGHTQEYFAKASDLDEKADKSDLSSKENTGNKSKTLTNSDTQYPTCNAVKTAVDGRALTTTYYSTIHSSNWIKLGEGWYQNELYDLEDLAAGDEPIVDLRLDSFCNWSEGEWDWDTVKNLNEVWNKILAIESSDGLAIAYAVEPINIDIPIQLKVVR